MQPTKRIDLAQHFASHAGLQTQGGRWQPSLIVGATFGNGYRLILETVKAGILDPGIRVHGASAATFWYKDASRRCWIMPSTEDYYSQIARTFNLEEVVDPFYGPYLRYDCRRGQARVMLPDPDVAPEFVIATYHDEAGQVSVATLKELMAYYGKRQHVQKGLYAKIKRPYKRKVK